MQEILLLSLLLLQFIGHWPVQGFINFEFEEDERKAQYVPDLIRSEGYPAEIHSIVTDDGYILEIHRIPHGYRNESTVTPKPIAFMVHCILCTSSIWVMQGPRQGLGYLLADRGFDVWMLNVRGTSYSKRHLKYKTNSPKFWDFSWHEAAIYDIPASINYILEYTKQEKLNYIGFSMGTTLFFASMSYKPEYNQKINKMVAIAPAVYLTHSTGLILDISILVDSIEKYARKINALEVPPDSWRVRKSLATICDTRNFIMALYCSKLMRMMGDISDRSLQMKNLRYYLQYFPDTTSIRLITHFYQVKNSDEFRLYSYGKKKNLRVYGSPYPPLYNLSQVSSPVYIFESLGDHTTTTADIFRLKSQLPNLKVSFKIDDPNFSHAHFCWGNDVHKIVYSKVIKVLKDQKNFKDDDDENFS